MSNRSRRKGEKLSKEEKNKKIVTSICCIIGIPILILFIVYCQASIMDILLMAKTGQAAINLGLPIDPACLPYSRRCPRTASVPKSTGKSIFELAENPPNSSSSANSPKKSTKFSTVKNKTMAFLDVKKYGVPYSMASNANWFMSSFGTYFITFWTTLRGLLSGFLEAAYGGLYEDGKWENPKGWLGQAGDLGKFTIILPFIYIFLNATQPLITGGAALWSSFSNQTLFILPLFIFSLIILPLLLLLTSFYLNIFLLKPNESGTKFKLFQKYGKRYKLWWAMLTVLGWFLSLSLGVWKDTEYQDYATWASLVVPGGMLILTSIGFANSV